MSKKKKRARCLYDTDIVARNLWVTMVKDFRSSEGETFCTKAERALAGDISEFRLGEVFPELGTMPASRFKRHAQMSNLLKKYRFASDAYDDEQLQKLTLDKYFVEQERLSQHNFDGLFVHPVVQRARKIARRILGSYDPKSTMTLARFGKKSSIGCPLNLAYIDHKLGNIKAFTGSSRCVNWFRENIYEQDVIMKAMVDEIPVNWNSENLAHESLKLVSVPKTWKTHRTITPLTLLGLFYSYGVGEQVTARLKAAGLDIRRLQTRHRGLVKQFSRSMSHATADLSAASDSLTKGLLNRILPREWYCALKPILTHQVQYIGPDEESLSAYTSSVLPMGNGCTFPVETLIFYCIIKALGELTETKGVFSVYGDDLIYPSGLHRYVVRVFPQLGLVLNLDKTFVGFPFRESCGADYYRGCDVRPFFLQGTHAQLTRTQYLAFLYKVYNGLTRRWDENEIRGTLYYLLTEIMRVARVIHRIPPSYPDTAGIKTSDPGLVPLDTWNLPWSPVRAIFADGTRWFMFDFLVQTSKRRYVTSVLPYYWLVLQGRDDEVPVGNFWDTDFSFKKVAPSSGLQWKKVRRPFSYRRGGRTYTKKRVKFLPTVGSRIVALLEPASGSITDWI